MYADDIILAYISVTDMQKMVNVCMKGLLELDLPINMSKCSFIRIGSRCKMSCCPIHFDNVDFAWVQEVRYLGVYIVNAMKFTCNYSNARKRFIRAFNTINSGVGSVNISVNRVGSVNNIDSELRSRAVQTCLLLKVILHAAYYT